MAAPAVAAIEGRGLIELGRDALQPGQKNHHVITKTLPKGHQHHGGQGQGRQGQKADRGEDWAQPSPQPAIDQAVFGIEPAEGDRRHHQRHQHRRIEGAAKQGHAGQGSVDEHRQGQRTQHNRRHDADQIQKSGDHDAPQHRIGDQSPQVRRTDELQRLAEIKAGAAEGHHQGQQRRNQHRDRQEDQRWGQEGPGGEAAGSDAGGGVGGVGLGHWSIVVVGVGSGTRLPLTSGC